MSLMPDVLISVEDAAVVRRLLSGAMDPIESDESTLDLAAKLLDARIVRPRVVPANRVRLGSAVTYQELPSGSRRSVTLVVPRDADAGAGRISVLSPVGRALLGHAEGQEVAVALPMGREVRVRLLAVTAPERDAIDQPAYA